MIERIPQAHALYCRLTGQRVSLRFDRERLWYELFRAGFNEADLQKVIRYLQREIRQGRRNVGALKLSNLLQLDRFEEDLNISRVALYVLSNLPASLPRLRRQPASLTDPGPLSRRAGLVASTLDSQTASPHLHLTVARHKSAQPPTVQLETSTTRNRAFARKAKYAHLSRCSTIYSVTHYTDQLAAVQLDRRLNLCCMISNIITSPLLM